MGVLLAWLVWLALWAPAHAAPPRPIAHPASPSAAVPIAVPTPATPQTYLDLWNRHALEARALLQATPSVPSDTRALETIRAVLAADRDRAFRAAQTPSITLRILEAQRAALGPAPAEGKVEPQWAADKRADLEARIKLARAPMLLAQDAQVTAAVLVAEIDARLNRKTSTELLARQPSPLLPFAWSGALAETRAALGELRRQLQHPGSAGQGEGGVGLAFAILASALGIYVAVVVQRAFRVRTNAALLRVRTPAAAVLLTFLQDIGILLLPLAVLLVMLGIVFLRLPRVPAAFAIESIVASGGGLVIFAMWVGRSLFSPTSAELRFVRLSDAEARRAVLIVLLLGLALVAELAVEQALKSYPFSPATRAVIAFPVLAATGALLWLLAEILSPLAGAAAEDMRAIDFRFHIAWLMRLIGIGGVAAGAAGYVELARGCLMPTLLTLATIGVGLLTFWRLTMLSDAVVARAAGETRHGVRLLPALYALVIVCVSLPLIALLWGVRSGTIADVFATLRDGVAIGSFRLSAGDVVVFFAVFAAGYGLTRWVQRMLQLSLFRALGLERGVESALLTVIGYAGLTLSLLVAIVSAGLDLSSLAIVAGALSVGAGLGLQGVVANFVSGIIVLIERPVRVGDWIEVGGFAGTVERISVRSTRLRTLAMDDVIIPNSEIINGAVRNRTLADRSGRTDLEVGVAYGTDLALAFAAVMDATRAVEAVLREPAPLVVLDRFDDSALVLKLFCVVGDVAAAPLARSQLRMEVYRLFTERGIAIPFPQREITLRQGAPTPA
ncbi:DUF3772 domain-containing protein [Novosphingobium huizhouense]|uniref:DUF3772 domain-containing protein n=1 Tax=Novosphingobium huizhouense TaxID=2866625 RepID=UPI001CD8ABEA|nr:DUF3772 domain-containing protein [Novosphingobium huizhouense]